MSQNAIDVRPCPLSDLSSPLEESLQSAAMSPDWAGFCCKHKH